MEAMSENKAGRPIDNFHDSTKCVPATPGKYQIKSKQLGGYIPVIWNGEGFEFLNGDDVPKSVARWWR